MAIDQNNAGNTAAKPQGIDANQESIELARRLPNDTPVIRIDVQMLNTAVQPERLRMV